jgi:DNA-binding IclR family transcriptional regulator
LAVQPTASSIQRALFRIQNDYLDIPELDLTLDEAAALWELEPSKCLTLLEVLVGVGFLARSPTGRFGRPARSDELAAIMRETAHGRPS